MAKKYIPDNSCLMCDKGSSPCRLKVTHHNNSKIYGEFLASEMDMIPGENIEPMGICSVTNSACKPEPIYWDKTNQGVKVNSFKLLFEDANLLCKKGGKVSVSFDVPDGVAGFGFGMNNGGQQFDKFRDIADLLKDTHRENFNGKTLDEIASSKGDFKRLYGEEMFKLDLKAKGYVINSVEMGQGQNGLDISAKDVKGNTDIVGDGKFSTRGGTPKIKTTKKSGNQLSDEWLTKGHVQGKSRLQKALPQEDATRIIEKVQSSDGSLKRLAAGVEPNGKLSYYEVDHLGTVGEPTTLGPANLISGSSKAATAINNISTSIQNAKYVSQANNFLVKNASTVSKVGKVVGRGAIVVGVALEAYNVYSTYQEEGHFGERTKVATGSAVGALALGLAGAQLGATIGAVGGPVGVIIGGLVGGIVGGLIGSGVGAEIGELF